MSLTVFKNDLNNLIFKIVICEFGKIQHVPLQLFSNFGAKIQNKHGKIKWDNFGWFSNTVHPVVPFGLLTFPEKSEFCSMSRLEKKSPFSWHERS